MKKLLLILLCLPFIGFGQQTYVPDDNFEQELINLGYDNVLDDYVVTSNINTVTDLSVTAMNISDLTGIEDFTALQWLSCSYNQLTSLDVSNCTNLLELQCVDNQLTALNVSQCNNMWQLFCHNNQLTTLDVSNCTGLYSFRCSNNQLTSLDVSNCTDLTVLNCSNNQLTTLDVSGCQNLTGIHCYNNFLSSLDVSGCQNLWSFWCSNNNLTYLDLSNNHYLAEIECEENSITSLEIEILWSDTVQVYLSCDYNALTCLDLSNSTCGFELSCNNNLLDQLYLNNGNWNVIAIVDASINNLSCVEVDNIGYANANWASSFDNGVSFSTNCNYANPCNTSSAIQEHTTNNELLKVTDILGRETKNTNQPLLYIYDDGTVEKRIVIE